MSGQLPTWLGELLGIESPGTGEGTVWQLDSTWNWAPWATFLVTAALVAWVVFWYARESPDTPRRVKPLLATLRIAAIGTLLLMIAELVITMERTGLPTVALLVDCSASMGIVDRGESTAGDLGQMPNPAPEATRGPPGSADSDGDTNPPLDSRGATRLDAGRRFLLENDARRLRQLDGRYKLALYAVATSAVPLGGELTECIDRLGEQTTDAAGSDATRLGAAVRQVLAEFKGSPPAAIVLLTDGITTDGPTLPDAAEIAARKGVPLFSIGIGDDKRIRDVELADLLTDDIVFAGDLASFDATLVGNGVEGETAIVELRETGREAVLAEQQLVLGPDRVPQKVRISYRPPRPGAFEYTVTIRPFENEMQTTNNAESRLVTVREEKVRVLLVASAPSYEFRFLKNMLERDETVDLRVVLQDADPDFAVVDPSALPVFPIRDEELFQYDVLILNDVNLQRMTARILGNIKSFVMEKGGGLVWIAGDRFAAQQWGDIPELSPLLPFPSGLLEQRDPAAQTGFLARPTALGLASPMMQLADTQRESQEIWNGLPPLYWMLPLSEANPTARILAEHPTRTGFGGRKLPLIMVQFVGAGKVLFHATDETWRWRYRAGDIYFARYWVQSMRYLARSKLLGSDRGVELTVNRQTYRHGDPVQIRVRFFDESAAPASDDSVQVVVEQMGETRRRILLRRAATKRGVFEGTFSSATTGRYHVLLARPNIEGRTPAADFRVVAPPGEFERLEMDSAGLTMAAANSRGKFYRLSESGNFVRDLPAGRQVPIQELPSQVLWNRWWMIALFVGLLISEWVLRKRYGML